MTKEDHTLKLGTGIKTQRMSVNDQLLLINATHS